MPMGGRDRDHPVARPFDDPHNTPPPRPPSPATSTIASSSDLELGSDAFSGGTLETPAQQARHHDERLHQQDLAREAYQRREAHKVLAADESTAEEREDRYQGILQAIDSLGAQQAAAAAPHHPAGASLAQSMAGASDDDEQLSPEAARLATTGGGERQDSERFDALRHTVDELGEGEEAARLIMESYQGRNLEQEAMRTMDPSDADHMPHPGDRYLPPHAVRTRAPPGGAMAARLNHTHARRGRCLPALGPPRPDFERNRVLPLPPARGGNSGKGQHAASASAAAGAWMPPEGSPAAAARAQHEPVGQEEQGQGCQPSDEGGAAPNDDQIGLGGAEGATGGPSETADDQIDYEQDAMRGADALYYAAEHAANPAVNDPAPGGGFAGGGGNIEAPGADPTPLRLARQCWPACLSRALLFLHPLLAATQASFLAARPCAAAPPSNHPTHALPRPSTSAEEFDVEGGALRGSDSMFYFKAGPAGSGGSEEEQAAIRGGAVWGALHSRDEQHSAFRRAMEDAAPVAKSVARGGKGGARSPRRRGAVAPSPPPPHVQARATGVAEHTAQLNSAASPQRGTVQHSEGVLLSLRKRQAERQADQASMQQLADRLRGSRMGGRPPPDPKTGLGRVLEIAVGRAAAAGLASAFFSELLTGQSVISQLLGRFEGPRQIEFALPNSQALAAAGGVPSGVGCAFGSGSMTWRVVWDWEVWLGRAAMGLFALLLAYESVHSNRPAFSTLFYLWF
ncbi:expressed protein [Chlorella variabilis]|uniref:Expressed protein n=1 Tax=Chlorella variabilis TaxID=554065 RepID=E1ZBI2_CHLVA|nr:expressed protein [Chlorella variabilis]EFN56858.1 expressed protein [Chlorella variabilis]|eukprot:XP_005848960.1 expressed protein [Chlorella variabilis]